MPDNQFLDELLGGPSNYASRAQKSLKTQAKPKNDRSPILMRTDYQNSILVPSQKAVIAKNLERAELVREEKASRQRDRASLASRGRGGAESPSAHRALSRQRKSPSPTKTKDESFIVNRYWGKIEAKKKEEELMKVLNEMDSWSETKRQEHLDLYMDAQSQVSKKTHATRVFGARSQSIQNTALNKITNEIRSHHLTPLTKPQFRAHKSPLS